MGLCFRRIPHRFLYTAPISLLRFLLLGRRCKANLLARSVVSWEELGHGTPPLRLPIPSARKLSGKHAELSVCSSLRSRVTQKNDPVTFF